VRLIWNPNRCEVAGAEVARQLERVASVRLDAIAGFLGISVGAMTSHSTPSSASCQYSAKPVALLRSRPSDSSSRASDQFPD